MPRSCVTLCRGNEGGRTPNLRGASAALSQLSYVPKVNILKTPEQVKGFRDPVGGV
jgi:hypothetical protein